jgi:hypothetical protein
MADADEEVAAAEPEERTRWAMMWLFGFAGVLLVYIGCFVIYVPKDDVGASLPPDVARALGVLISLPGFFLIVLLGVMLIERYSFHPEGQRLVVDRLLMLP